VRTVFFSVGDLPDDITDAKKTESEKAEEADAEILEAIKSRRKLASDMELAKGIQYTNSLKTRCAPLSTCLVSIYFIVTFSWRPPKYILNKSMDQNQKLRDKFHILVDGEDIPPPIEHFAVSAIGIILVDASSF
jgi:ATP-dependent RNA helicase DDX41